MSDLIDRQAAIDAYGEWYVEEGSEEGFIGTVKQLLEGLPSAQPEDWMEKNKDMILQAGKEGREYVFRIGGRLFAIRELAQ